MKTPIAVIGIGCRFPGGVDSPEAFWSLMCEGIDAVGEVPADRWNSGLFYSSNEHVPGKAYVRSAGFLKESPFAFDALFFGISPREADSLDPQQRLLLEVAYEAIEDAGLTLGKLKNSRTGVFIGGFALDNMLEQLSLLNIGLADTYTPASLTMTMLSNRLSYVFGLQGPSMTVDTACSSSLVATHLACRSIWAGESEIAMAGGVNVLLRPEFFVMLSKGKFLSTHGRCKTYDLEAGGYVRSEGAGIAILKPLHKAQADGDNIWAVIHNTGVNQDGTTAGISSPNQVSQETLLKEVLRDAGIPPKEIHYVEAHGTGTQAGDRAEAGALHNVLFEGRSPGDKCVVGSIKTNIGHAEAAAGIAGLIKAALVVAHGRIPPNLHFNIPNPNIPFNEMCIRVPTRLEEWTDDSKRRLACVSSFGYGGTNAAVVMEAPARAIPGEGPGHGTGDPQCPAVVPLSARTPSALTELAARYARFLVDDPGLSPAGLVHTLGFRRTHFKHRVAFLTTDIPSLREDLEKFSRGEMPEGACSGVMTGETSAPLVFVFTGMGPQHPGMGMDLFWREKVFRDAMLRCDQIYKGIAGMSILEEMAKDETITGMGDARIAQPANFFIQAALTELLEAYGIRPDAVVGHSVGEVAAAYVSGALTLEEALLVSYHRARLQQTLAGSGTLMAVELTESEALSLLGNFPGVSIAAINGPSSLTLAGDTRELTAVKSGIERMGRFNKFMNVAIPFHSAKMDAIETELKDPLKGLSPQSTTVPLYSTVTGKRISGDELTARYWWLNARRTVRFADAVRDIVTEQHGCNFLEVGPHPVLRASLLQCIKDTKATGRPVQTMNRHTGETHTVRRSIGELYCLGYEPRWENLGGAGGRYVKVPRYPWQRVEHKIRRTARAHEQLQCAGNHPFLARRIDTASPAWHAEVDSELYAYVQDHRVSGEVVMPGAAYLEAGLAAHSAHLGSETCVLENVVFHNMLILDTQAATRVSVTVDPKTDRFEVHSRRTGDDDVWTLHATGCMVRGGKRPETVEFSVCRGICAEEKDIAGFYQGLADMGLVYGPSFQTVARLWTDPQRGRALARIEARGPVEEEYLIHPTLIDGAFQSLVALVRGGAGRPAGPVVPVSVERLRFYKRPKKAVYAFSSITRRDAGSLNADLTFFEEDGEVIARLEGVRCRQIMSRDRSRDTLVHYEHTWRPMSADDIVPRRGTENESWLILGERALSEAVIREFSRRGINFIVAAKAAENCPKDESVVLRPDDVSSMRELVVPAARSGLTHVLYLWSFDSQAEEKPEARIINGVIPLRNLVEALREGLGEQKAHIVAVTRDAHVVVDGDTGANLAAAPISALGRLIENEYANITFRHLDFDTGTAFNGRASDLLFADTSEREIAVRKGEAWVRRLNRSQAFDASVEAPSRQRRCAEQCVEFLFHGQGETGHLLFRETGRPGPNHEEVEIRLHSASLNFDGAPAVHGRKDAGECIGATSFSGVVTNIGTGIKHFHVGDVVMGVGAGAPRSFFTAPALMVALKPDLLNWREAAGLGAFLTAFHAVTEVARLKRNEKILVRNAAHPVGLAAIEVASWISAQVLATVADAEAARNLMSRGVEKIYASCGTDLEDEVRSDTDGFGVDVVLDIDPDRTVARAFGLLAPCGRLVEIGRREVADDICLPATALERNLTFASADFSRLLIEKPQYCAGLLGEVRRLLADGSFRPLPITAFPAAEAAGALHPSWPVFGGVAITFEGAEVQAMTNVSEHLFRADGTYLVTGGTKGFGLEVAKWIAEEGGGNLVLVSRGGADESTVRAVAEMEAAGAGVTVMRADVGNESDVRRIVDEISEKMPPLRGVFHAAVVLEDALFADVTADSLARTLHAKVGGFLNLHEATQGCPVEVFVGFSSVSALIGNTGQASYVVGNAFLDAFARYRKNRGLPCTSVNFGAISDVGILKKRANIEEFFNRHGVKSMKPHDACVELGRVIRAGVAQAGIFEVEWETLCMAMPVVRSSPVFGELLQDGAGTGAGERSRLEDLREQLSEFEPEARAQWLQERVTQKVTEVLGISSSHLDTGERLANLGIDSLSAVELGVGLRESLGAEFSTVNLLNVASVSRLVEEITEQLGFDSRLG